MSDHDRYEDIREALQQAIDAVIWMSAAEDFAPGGKAQPGWANIRDNSLPRWMKLLKPSQANR